MQVQLVPPAEAFVAQFTLKRPVAWTIITRLVKLIINIRNDEMIKDFVSYRYELACAFPCPSGHTGF